MEEKLMCIAGW